MAAPPERWIVGATAFPGKAACFIVSSREELHLALDLLSRALGESLGHYREDPWTERLWEDRNARSSRFYFGSYDEERARTVLAIRRSGEQVDLPVLMATSYHSGLDLRQVSSPEEILESPEMKSLTIDEVETISRCWERLEGGNLPVSSSPYHQSFALVRPLPLPSSSDPSLPAEPPRSRAEPSTLRSKAEAALVARTDVVQELLGTHRDILSQVPKFETPLLLQYLRGSQVRFSGRTYVLERPAIDLETYEVLSDLLGNVWL